MNMEETKANGQGAQPAPVEARHKPTLAEAGVLFGVGVKNSAEQIGYFCEHGLADQARKALTLLKDRLAAAETALMAASPAPSQEAPTATVE